MDDMARPSITILGGGLAGLTLGRCLRKQGIPYTIYDRASSAPRHTYGITLEPWAYKPLLHVLDMDETTFRKTLAVDTLNDQTQQTTPSTALRANRYKLETLLREDQPIHLDHVLESATPNPNNHSLDLTFKNGTTITSSRTVDTLGIHSPLRAALLPELQPTIHPYAVYSGKRYIARDLWESTYAPHFTNTSTPFVLTHSPRQFPTTSPPTPRLEISLNSHDPNPSKTSISYIYSRPAHSPNDPLHNPYRPLSSATNIPPELYTELSTLLSQTTTPLPPPFPLTFTPTTVGKDRLLHWLMRSILIPLSDLQNLASQFGVLMLGDAVHGTPILGGKGANAALRDAVAFSEMEFGGEGENDDEEWRTRVELFYRGMWDVWREEREGSVRRLEAMHRGKEVGGEEGEGVVGGKL